MGGFSGPSGRTPAGGQALALGIAAKEDERFALARSLLGAAALSNDRVVSARATAHLCHLDYYDGEFEKGATQALAVRGWCKGLAHAEASLYASVNLIALNRVDEAVRLAQSAAATARRVPDLVLRSDLRLRVARQLTHAFVVTGQYGLAAAEAEAAAAVARRRGTESGLALAAYLRGYVRAARGDSSALIYLKECEQSAGLRPLGHWVRYVMAVLRRDDGHVAEAMALHDASSVRQAWEEPLFQLAAGGPVTEPDVDAARDDERPFVLATRGVLALARGDPEAASPSLAAAVAEFARLRFEHHRRGVALALVAARFARGQRDMAAAGLAAELPDLRRFRIHRWPWWHQSVATAVLSLARRMESDQATLTLLSPRREAALDVDEVLLAYALSERETQVVEVWLAHPEWRRATIASSLGISEGVVRQHLNSARRKLRCDPRRGPEALRTRMEDLAQRIHLRRGGVL
jgi:DNA-binding CsgD family transcriptional regulator